jgi:hypothetical protein
MSSDAPGWDSISSLEGLEVDWDFKSESSAGNRAFSRLTMEDLSELYRKKNIPVKLVTEKDQCTAFLIDLSQGGISLRAKLSYTENSQLVKLGFIVGDQKVISRGRIKHIRAENEWTILGIEFVGLTGENQDFLAQLYSSVKFKGGRF